MRSPELQAALMRNRQRLALDRLGVEASWILDSMTRVAAADMSHQWDEMIRRELAVRRPRVEGDLVVTHEESELETRIRSFFTARSTVDFYVFLSQWPEAGALEIRGDTLALLAMKLLRFDADGVYGCDTRLSEVFSLDRTLERDGQIVWELFRFVAPVPLQPSLL